MSDFAVKLFEVSHLDPHPNADKLELAYLKGVAYQFVVQKNTLSENQLVAYIPTDALVPKDFAALLGLPVKEDKAVVRIKAIRLRGQRSEGVLVGLPTLSLDPKLAWPGLDLTELLGITKYEPPELAKDVTSRSRDLMAMPVNVQVYDIENAQRYPEVFDAILKHEHTGEPYEGNSPAVRKAIMRADDVIVTEKLEGTHWWARIDRDGETIHVGQRRFEIRPPGFVYEDTVKDNEPRFFYAVPSTNAYWAAFFKQEIDRTLSQLSRYYAGQAITLRGEMVGDGIQGNYYGYPDDVRAVFMFEIELDGEPMDADVAFSWFFKLNVLAVPILYVGYLENYATSVEELVHKAHGETMLLADTSILTPRKLREGIVVKPAKEFYNPAIGRTILKVRDPIYLEGT